ncbi:MAG: hypothetical protein AB1656_19550 [Candidatus Omnitrophota bacterium]
MRDGKKIEHHWDVRTAKGELAVSGESLYKIVLLSRRSEEAKSMTLTEVLPVIKQLPILDKLRLIRILAQELDTAENIFPFEPYKIYYLATPYNFYGAGKTLMDSIY